ncbi:MAG: hypothetical protein ACXW34_02160 [Nitrospira sp.]
MIRDTRMRKEVGTYDLCPSWPPAHSLLRDGLPDHRVWGMHDPCRTDSTGCGDGIGSALRAGHDQAHEARADSTALASSRFSADALRVAEVIGVLPVLNEIAALEASQRQPPLDMLINRQRLTDQVL